MISRWIPGLLAALPLVALTARTAHAEPEYERVTLTINAPYLLIPVYEVNAEVAIDDKWSAAVRGGGGNSNFVGEDARILEVGAQGIRYLTGTPRRGVQIGLDARYVSYEQGGMLAGIGDGVALGPFIGYKRVFGSGVALGAQLGAEVAASGESQGPVFPYLALSFGFAFWPTGGVATDDSAASIATTSSSERPAAKDDEPLRNPLDYHRGLMFGWSLGGGAVTTENCSECDMNAGLAVDGSIGWFLHRRVALMYDATASVGISSSELGSAGFGLQSIAVQYWPHEDVWLKVGVGAARLISVSFLDTPTYKNGGGGTLAAGYEFHHDGNFNMDAQLRVTHGSFDQEDGEEVGMNTFAGLVGINWY